MGKRKNPSPNKKPQLTQKIGSDSAEPKKTNKADGIKKERVAPKKEPVVPKDMENIPDPNELTDEEVANFPIDNLPVEKDGTRVLATVELEPPENYTDTILMKLPIRTDEEMIKKNVVMHIIYPYIEAIPLSEIDADESILKGKFGTVLDDCFYTTSEKVFESYVQLLENAGITINVAEGVDNKTFLETVNDAKNGVRKNGYYDDFNEYWFGGTIYHENDVIWLPYFSKDSRPGNLQGFSANLDKVPGQVFTPCDVTRIDIDLVIKDGKKVLSKMQEFELYQRKNSKRLRKLLETPILAEKIFWMAKECAKDKDDIGFAAVCKDGKFLVPCYSRINFQTFEIEYLIVLFNAVGCLSSHHMCRGLFAADVGNMPIRTYVRFLSGEIFDWPKRIEQEIAAYRVFDPDYSPDDNPYDDPTFGTDTGNNGSNM